MFRSRHPAPDLRAPRAPVVPGADDTLWLAADRGIATVIELFAVPPERLDAAVGAAIDRIAGAWMADERFRGAVLLRGRPCDLAVYAQWDRANAAPLPAVPEDERSLRPALPERAPLFSTNFEVAFTHGREHAAPPTVLSLAETPLAHLGLFRVGAGAQDELLRRAAEHGPASFGTPGLRAIAFHRGADGRSVVNLGLWSSFDGFAALLDQPGFARDGEYFRDIAAFRPAFFDVVAVKARAAAEGATAPDGPCSPWRRSEPGRAANRRRCAN